MKQIHEILGGGLAGRSAVLVVPVDRKDEQAAYSAEEMVRLSHTAGIRVRETFSFRLHHIHPATYIGEGKVTELRNLSGKENISLFLFDTDLSPVQQRNLEQQLGCPVVDRTGLILEIFAQHARSSEGKIQVELAQLTYALPRLTGQGLALSRIGGRLAVRGPGEMKLEVQRRHITQRIHRLNEKIKEIEKHRQLLRQARKRKEYPVVALLGYTNVGKSTLLNRLSKSQLLVADKLFSTLDPATRLVHLGQGSFCLVTDTVGLLNRLPHHLIAAFRATLEEVAFADLLLCLYDVSSLDIERQRKTTFEVISLLNLKTKPYLEVFNKIDAVKPEERDALASSYPSGLFLSAKTGEGIEILRQMLRENLASIQESVTSETNFTYSGKQEKV